MFATQKNFVTVTLLIIACFSVACGIERSEEVVSGTIDGMPGFDSDSDLETNPDQKDTDNDGLTDLEEIKTYGTSPHVADTDGDQLLDGEEVLEYFCNPLSKDTDEDELNDHQEVTVHKTSCTKTDTDGDTLTDKEEIDQGTDPTKADSDGDGDNDDIDCKPLNPDVYPNNPKPDDVNGSDINCLRDKTYDFMIFNKNYAVYIYMSPDLNDKSITIHSVNGGNGECVEQINTTSSYYQCQTWNPDPWLHGVWDLDANVGHPKYAGIGFAVYGYHDNMIYDVRGVGKNNDSGAWPWATTFRRVGE